MKNKTLMQFYFLNFILLLFYFIIIIYYYFITICQQVIYIISPLCLRESRIGVAVHYHCQCQRLTDYRPAEINN